MFAGNTNGMRYSRKSKLLYTAMVVVFWLVDEWKRKKVYIIIDPHTSNTTNFILETSNKISLRLTVAN